MRNSLFAIVIFCNSIVYSQSTRVCGVVFGMSYEKAEEILKKSHGEKSVLSDKDELVYYDFRMGNHTFNDATFYFQYSEYGGSYFSEAVFSRHFDLDRKERAYNFMENVAYTLSLKYKNIISKYDDDGYKYYLCGSNPFNENEYLIELNIDKSKSKGGDYFYYVTLYYGPVNFVDPTSDF